MKITATPALHRTTPNSRPYRLYTVEHCTFDAFRQYKDGGPSMVAMPGFGVSTSSVCTVLSTGSAREEALADPKPVTLNLTVFTGPGYSDIEKHPLDGTKCATVEEARQMQFEAGALGFMVYEAKDADEADLAIAASFRKVFS